MGIRKQTTASPPKVARIRLDGARLAYENSRMQALGGFGLWRSGARGLAVAALATSIEESIKSMALAMTTDSESGDAEVETLLANAFGGHTSRLSLGNTFLPIIEPWFGLLLFGMALMAKVLNRDERAVWSDFGVTDRVSKKGLADYIWRLRQHGLYVDWTADGWTTPVTVQEVDFEVLRRLAIRFSRTAARVLRAASARLQSSSGLLPTMMD
jgi:AbiV family abortive infection protein